MPDPFDTDYENLTSPAVSHDAIVPSDLADLPMRVLATGTTAQLIAWC